MFKQVRTELKTKPQKIILSGLWIIGLIVCAFVAYLIIHNILLNRFDTQNSNLYHQTFSNNSSSQIRVVRKSVTLNDVFQTQQKIEYEPQYDIESLKPYYNPKDKNYYKEINNYYSLVENWESVVGIDPFQERFKNKESLSVSLAKPYHVYFGLLHSHTEISDGMGSSELALKTARDVAKLDFFAVTDHSEAFPFQQSNSFEKLQQLCSQYSNSQFVSIPGFEYSHALLGHYVVLNTNSTHSSLRDLFVTSFYNWLAAPEQENAIVFFAHPGFHPYRRLWDHFRFKADYRLKNKIVGIESIHKNLFSPSLRGFTGKQSYLDDAWHKGWEVGPLASQDNHRKSWGIQDGNRIALLLPQLNQQEIWNALKKRRFYSTQMEQIYLSVAARKNVNQWSEMGEEISREEIKDENLEIQLRLAHVSNRFPLSHIELVWNGSVIHTFSTPAFQFEPDYPDYWFEKWLKLNGQGNLDPNEHPVTKPAAETIQWLIPSEIWSSSGDKQYFYFRIYHGIEKKLITITSPNILK